MAHARKHLECAAQEPLCAWIEQGRLDYRPFVSVEFPVAEIGQAIDLLATREASKIFLRY